MHFCLVVWLCYCVETLFLPLCCFPVSVGSVSSVVPAVACGGREFHLKKDSSSVEQGEQISWWHSAFNIVILLELCLTFLCVYSGRA